VQGFRTVLLGLIDEDDRERFETYSAEAAAAGGRR
jgi:hypothetical protein